MLSNRVIVARFGDVQRIERAPEVGPPGRPSGEVAAVRRNPTEKSSSRRFLHYCSPNQAGSRPSTRIWSASAICGNGRVPAAS